MSVRGSLTCMQRLCSHRLPHEGSAAATATTAAATAAAAPPVAREQFLESLLREAGIEGEEFHKCFEALRQNGVE